MPNHPRWEECSNGSSHCTFWKRIRSCNWYQKGIWCLWNMGEAPSKLSLNFPSSLISYVNQSLMTVSDGMKKLDWSSFGTKTPEELQPKGFEIIQNTIPLLMGMGCCMLNEKHLDCFNEGHPPNSQKRWLVDEIINF